MSTPIDDGGPAFPYPELADEHGLPTGFGMSLRDWFAGQALAGLLANPETLSIVKGEYPKALGVFTYEAADAMLAARKRCNNMETLTPAQIVARDSAEIFGT